MIRDIYLLATDGLCNRMRTIDSAITLSSKLNRKLKVIWVSNELLNSSFHTLFNPVESMDMIESTSHSRYLSSLRFNVYPKNNPGIKKSRLRRYVAQALWKVNKMKWNIGGCVFYDELLEIADKRFKEDTAEAEQIAYDLIAKKIHSSIDDNSATYIASCWRLCPDQEFYAHFKPVNALQDRIDKTSEKFSYTLGLHIRRTDHREAIEMSGLDKFVDLIETQIRLNERVTFFLATDDRETESFLKKKFGDRIMTSEKSSFSRDSEKGIQDAVVDLYCLSKTAKIYGSFRSSFSQVAADISGIEVQTVS